MAKKPLPLASGDVLWTIGMSGYSAAGSICHVDHGSKLHRTREECQHEIDTRPGWLGMGDRSRYYPVALVIA